MPSERDKTRRWWQFSLRDMIALTFIAGLAGGWWVDHQRMQSRVYDSWFEGALWQSAPIDSDDPRYIQFVRRLQEAMK